ncbi:MAG: biotin transporter BioY [Clostridia bacterium]|nr:biotin transporter BioY [Clostridia bacterium]
MTAKEMTRTAIYTALLCIAAFILRVGGEAVVPFSFLPIMILLSGAMLGSRLGSLSVLIYVMLGLFGVPVFAQAPYGGFSYILQPTFGFLLGDILAAFIVGRVIEKTKFANVLRYALAMLLGIVAIYLLGLPYLYLILNVYLGEPMTFWGVIKIGFLPFILMDLIKGLFAGAIALRLSRRDVYKF